MLRWKGQVSKAIKVDGVFDVINLNSARLAPITGINPIDQTQGLMIVIGFGALAGEVLFIFCGLAQWIAAQVVTQEQRGCAFNGDLKSSDGHALRGGVW